MHVEIHVGWPECASRGIRRLTFSLSLAQWEVDSSSGAKYPTLAWEHGVSRLSGQVNKPCSGEYLAAEIAVLTAYISDNKWRGGCVLHSLNGKLIEALRRGKWGPKSGLCQTTVTGGDFWVGTVAYELQIKRRYKITSVYSDLM